MEIYLGALPDSMVPVDIDVTPMDNSKTSKQGVSRTYKGFDGYAPMMAYIGTEGYAVNFELREGKQHCQNGTVEFLLETISLCKKLTDKPLLVRLDSGIFIKADVTKVRLSNGDLRKIHKYLNGDLRHITLYINGDLE